MTTVKEAGLATIDMKLEVIVIPVSDAERVEQFYRKLGYRQDVTPPGSGVFQFTPHGSMRCIVGYQMPINKVINDAL